MLFSAIKKKLPLPTDDVNKIMQITADSVSIVKVQPKGVYKNIVPDVKGMGLKDAVYMLETFGMHVIVKGKGRVSDQSVQPGTTVTKGQNIVLQLS